ncbi:TetR/AcrR family transcriptional regulator [Streptomyces sp. NPDC001536]|uniref:TetR/AcrR family transcriptional regulator n=1 Tax=Streptomyces sp. NPDC001536 TaxID=3364583 RepID=UPI00369479A2
MASADTTKPASRRPYHHGDLRRAVLTAALDVIAADGPSTLSLRDLARRAGVSHAAPAHHFGDRTGLLTAIAAEGFGLLATALREAPDLKEAGVRYVRFAREHPAHFQVMFAPGLLRADDLELTTARALAGDALREAVSAVHPESGHSEGSRPQGSHGIEPRLAGVAAWSLAHGFATLLLGHNLDGPVGDQDPEEVFRTLAGMLFRAT